MRTRWYPDTGGTLWAAISRAVRHRVRLDCLSLVLWLACAGLSWSHVVAAEKYSELQIRAVYLYNLPVFVRWPGSPVSTAPRPW